MSNVGNVTFNSPSAATSSPTGSTGISGLTQQDFLELMVAQFQASDPLADGDSGSGGGSGGGAADYVNQLMSMTNLTTMQSMSSQQGILMAQNLPGQTVTITTPQNTTVTGVVSSTTIDTNGVNVMVNGALYPSNEITSLTPAQAAPTGNPGSTSN